MSSNKSTSWSYTEAFASEDAVQARARERSFDLGITPVSPGVGAVLTVLAASSKSQAAVEIGSGAGVSGVCILRGLPSTAVFTTIDHDVEHLKAAREAFAEAGVPANRVRAIPGRAAAVLPRLTDGAYDFVLVDADKANALLYAEQGIRLLRRGGLLVVNDALDRDRVSNPAHREPTTVRLRELHRALRTDERLCASILPTGDGLIVAARL
ncbi:O-methyltransferase [Sinomonas sp. ASV486]|uniref:O-methyltransferase n=1 Tax=Sinomonas puerhi TaxID=3238584 RepID=A0AB39KZM1_9MICC|nr:O-methyltransferase [Sinomonas sp. ASV486]MDQ4491079.1 O-methyltransferase [Sinomonas sp. ASV486]